MDQVTQQNAALVEEAAAAADSMLAQAQELLAVVGTFKLAPADEAREPHAAGALPMRQGSVPALAAQGRR